jgi:hypothetical protein
MHHEADEVSLHIGDDVVLASVDFLPGVVAAWTAALGGLHGLAVDDAGGWARLTSGRLARLHDQEVIDRRAVNSSASRPHPSVFRDQLDAERNTGGQGRRGCADQKAKNASVARVALSPVF